VATRLTPRILFSPFVTTASLPGKSRVFFFLVPPPDSCPAPSFPKAPQSYGLLKSPICVSPRDRFSPRSWLRLLIPLSPPISPVPPKLPYPPCAIAVGTLSLLPLNGPSSAPSSAPDKHAVFVSAHRISPFLKSRVLRSPCSFFFSSASVRWGRLFKVSEQLPRPSLAPLFYLGQDPDNFVCRVRSLSSD